jgi:predicted  nucleic acid-binding Zn-ribbon protein
MLDTLQSTAAAAKAQAEKAIAERAAALNELTTAKLAATESARARKDYQEENGRLTATLAAASRRTASLEADLQKLAKEKEELTSMLSELMALQESKLGTG